jgi:hypothetical protein
VVRLSVKERLAKYVHKTPEGCWMWTGYLNHKGYGRMVISKKSYRAHRVAYEQWVGPIPEGLILDHLCRNRACINPDHLEPVTWQENNWRVHGVTDTTCRHGHEMTEENVEWRARNGRMYRDCRECRKQNIRNHSYATIDKAIKTAAANLDLHADLTAQLCQEIYAVLNSK